ncbi:MAG: hypothetical protein GX452_02450 [Ignavibacteriales bacterium]|jgi:hypothetical protein|nr:hypothetical protein [Ignavibacteriaceae bacterium]NLH60248.1 hypothetical protein [Ignavibacteriales bacterium]HOJ17366.1 hypothetical protein [Ignavibacteriaceae bacterium]HPO54816.1 hypothetical protein [Ignavibacteriaceae bacterium]
MNKLLLIIILINVAIYPQIKNTEILKPTVKESIISDSPNLVFGFINPSNFFMRHSYSMSYSSFGNNGLALGVYTNNMLYKVADNLTVEVDASLIHSPYSSFGKDHQNMINGIYLSRAQINYQPWENFNVIMQYRSVPDGFYSPYGYGYNRLGIMNRSNSIFPDF